MVVKLVRNSIWVGFLIGIAFVFLWLVFNYPLSGFWRKEDIFISAEQKAFLRDHSFNSLKVVRWPDGSLIKVYDETNFEDLDYVLEEWNKVLNKKIFLIKVEEKERANVIIRFEDMSEKGYAGLATTHFYCWGRIKKGEIKIDPVCGRITSVYLHEIGHILGCGNHLGEGIMSKKTMVSENIDEEPRLILNFYILSPLVFL